MTKRKRIISDEYINEIVRDYVEDIYDDVKSEEEEENVKIIEDFESLKDEESYGDGFDRAYLSQESDRG